MSDKLRTENTDKLFEAILSLKTVDECYDFFEDLCTATEIVSISQRMTIVRMLKENKMYTEISAETGASTATISRVNRSLKYGTGGYELILERLGQQKEDK